MKKRVTSFLSALFMIALCACGNSVSGGNRLKENLAEQQTGAAMQSSEKASMQESQSEEATAKATGGAMEKDKMYIKIGEHTLTVAMAENGSAAALTELLKSGDITVNASDYNSFEKYGDLGTSLPANDEQITTEPGDVILYQGNLIALYYDTNTWNFTRLGKVEGVSQDELKQILGDGNITMVLSLND